ncbi:MAG: aminoacyl-tRNA hydrolase [Gammaproteobacteria bacterium]
MQKICMIGLGNPGEKYSSTKHNIGSSWVQKALHSYGISLNYSPKDKVFFAQSHKQEIEWIIPDCYVNESGLAIKKILRNKNFSPKNIFIIHDDLDLPLGQIRIKEGGGHGGHNGLRDIIKHCTSEFMRIRVGIDHPGDKDLVSSWVLTKFSKKDQTQLEHSFVKFLRAVEMLLNQKISAAQKFLHTSE